MRQAFIFLLLIKFSLSSDAQNEQRPIVNVSDFESEIVSDSTNRILNDTSLVYINLKADYWDHTVCNPFKTSNVTFPLKLKFEDSTYHSPIGKENIVTSRYGWRNGKPHKGIDIDLVKGDSVYAMFDGIIRFSRFNGGHGNTVIIRHYNGLETLYAHLSEYGVKENDTVSRGQYLGKGGESGNARGSHLHLEVNNNGIAINPEYLFDFSTNKIRANTLWVTRNWTNPIAHNSKLQSETIPFLTEEDALASLVKQHTIYIVKPGDTLSRISKRNNISMASLCKLNALKSNTIIKIGQKLIIEKSS